ncbi:MAG: hypothetical protein GY769_14145 [bacterium]|nr:hypothetical protein [bacterium]
MAEDPVAEPTLDRFLGEPTEEIADWRWLWQGDHEFPIRSRRGAGGRLVVWLKKLLRPLVRAPQADMWDRQRQFNLVLLAHLEKVRDLQIGLGDLGRDLQRVQGEIVGDLREVQSDLVNDLDKINTDLQELDVAFAVFKAEGLKDLARQTEALFSLLDQKVERLRHQAGALGSEAQRPRGRGSPPTR